MAESRQNYAMLKELLKDEDFRKLSEKVLGMQMRLEDGGAVWTQALQSLVAGLWHKVRVSADSG